jgi:hypothetical protein
VQSEVGLYFLASKAVTAESVEMCFGIFSFNDQKPSLFISSPKIPTHSEAHFYLRSYHHPPGDLPRSKPIRWERYIPPRTIAPGGNWRTLAIEVHPNTIECFWDGRSTGKLFRQEIMDHREQVMGSIHGLQPALSPRDGLGLCVANGCASFRRVIVEPLLLD